MAEVEPEQGKCLQTLYTGPSMNPLFWAGDRLVVVPYGEKPIRRGDVVVYPHPYEPRQIVHRVIAITPGGIRTRGDNNSHVDTYVIARESIVGYVASVRRGNKARAVSGGKMGLVFHRIFLLRRLLHTWAFTYLHPFYHRVADTGWFYGWHRPFITLKLVRFKHARGEELQLLAGRRIIARRTPGSDEWMIRFPFEFFLDKKTLPAGKNHPV